MNVPAVYGTRDSSSVVVASEYYAACRLDIEADIDASHMLAHPMNRNWQGFLHFRPIFVLLDSIYCCLEVLLRRDGLLERTEVSSEPSEARSRHIKANSGRNHTPDSEIDGN